MSYRWLDESAECCIFGLPEDSLPEIPIIKPIQNPPANSPKMVRSRRGGRPRGGFHIKLRPRARDWQMRLGNNLLGVPYEEV